MNLKKDIIALREFEPKDFVRLINRAIELKTKGSKAASRELLKGKTLGLVFDKPSTRTRVSFEVAMIQLGGLVTFLSANDTQLIRGEPIADTARVLSRYLDGLVVRTYSQELLEALAFHSSIPVINALTDRYHPCQVLSDLQTIQEKKGGLKDLKIVWVGDGNNVCNSWIEAASVLGLCLVISTPVGYAPNEEIYQKAVSEGKGDIQFISDPHKATKDADVIYTDVWASMGQESEQSRRRKVFQGYQVNSRMVSNAKKDVLIMHCLPAHRGEEITDEVLEGTNSIVWDQAENKLHMHKAILEELMVS
ncbi:MAG: ornithine carbamoyltransferase [Pseudomonadota bacterium]